MKTPSKKILVEFERAKKNGAYNDHYTLAVDGELPGAFKVKVVETLPETGEEGIIYLVPKEGTTGDVYNEYIWALNEQEEYGWERVGSTAVTIEIDDELNTESENPVQNKVIAQQIINLNGAVENHETRIGANEQGLSNTAILLDDEMTGRVEADSFLQDQIYQLLENKQDTLKRYFENPDVELVTIEGRTNEGEIEHSDRVEVSAKGTGGYAVIQSETANSISGERRDAKIMAESNDYISSATIDADQVSIFGNEYTAVKADGAIYLASGLTQIDANETNVNSQIFRLYSDDARLNDEPITTQVITGFLDNLQTEDKSNLVNAINELAAKLDDVEQRLSEI